MSKRRIFDKNFIRLQRKSSILSQSDNENRTDKSASQGANSQRILLSVLNI